MRRLEVVLVQPQVGRVLDAAQHRLRLVLRALVGSPTLTDVLRALVASRCGIMLGVMLGGALSARRRVVR